MNTDDARPIIRTLRDALLEARPYLVRAVEPANGGVRVGDFAAGMRALEALDGAIAEADEVLT